MKKISHETKKTIPWDETAHTVRWMPEFVWIITGISEGRTHIGSNGAGKRIEFTLNIKCVDDDPNAVLGDLRDVLKQYLPDGFSLPDIPKIPDMTNLF